MLRALDVEAVALREQFPESTDDIVFIEQLSQKEVVYLTADRKIKTRQIEAQTLKLARVTSLFPGPFWSKKNFWQQAAWLIAKWPSIEGFVESVTRGTTAEIKQNGKI